MKVSALIPTFNREKYIKDCIESVLDQTYKDIEICVYDDCSTDKTIDIVKKYKGIRWHRGVQNMGVGWARNRLLEMCNTEIAFFVDSDDLCNKYRVSVQMDYLMTTNRPNVINSVFFNDPKDINIKEKREDKIKYEFPLITMMFQKNLAPKFDEHMRYGEDLIWGEKIDFARLYEIGYYIRMHPNRLGVEHREAK